MTDRENATGDWRLVVVFLRFRADMTQTGFAQACGIKQSDVSRFEAGQKDPSEEILRRMAMATGVRWSLVVHLRRFFATFLDTAGGGKEVKSDTSPFERTVMEAAVLAGSWQLMESAVGFGDPPAPEEARREAEEVWMELQRFPVPYQWRMIEMSLRSSRSWAMSVRICEASAQADEPEVAIELADLALWIAEQIPGEEDWRSRVQAYACAHVARARRADRNFMGSGKALAKARKLWQAGEGADPDGLIPEKRWLEILSDFPPAASDVASQRRRAAG